MTQNQIEFNKLQEQKRFNTLSQSIIAQNNRWNYELGKERNVETERHNRATELLGQQQLGETERHNRENERFNLLSLNEQQRHNRSVETETKRSNQAREAETHRANTVQEQLQRRSLDQQLEYNRATISLQRQSQAEIARANRAREQEQQRANKAQESLSAQRNAEQSRANKASEAIRSQYNDIQVRHLGIEQARVEIQRRDSDVKNLSSPAGVYLHLKDKASSLYKRVEADVAADKRSKSERLADTFGVPQWLRSASSNSRATKKTQTVGIKPTIGGRY